MTLAFVSNMYITFCSQLEDDTERLRRDVVQRKRVLEAHHVTKLNSDLESLGKILAELKSMFPSFILNFFCIYSHKLHATFVELTDV